MNSEEATAAIKQIIEEAQNKQTQISAASAAISKKTEGIHSPQCICTYCQDREQRCMNIDDAKKKQAFPNENVFVVPETSVGKDWEQFTIRGKCSASFFAQTVMQFYSTYAKDIGEKDASAKQNVYGEWSTLFQAKRGFFTIMFGAECNFIITQVPCLHRIPEKSLAYGTNVIQID